MKKFENEKKVNFRKDKKRKRGKDHGKIDEVEGEEDASVLAKNDDEGVEMTGFNLNDEKEDGHYDGSGNFVWKKAEQPMQEDAWLENVSTEAMDAALLAKKNRSANVESNDTESNEPNFTRETSHRTIFKILLPQETVMQGLRRLGEKKVRRGKKPTKNEIPPARSEEDKEKFNDLTLAADFLMHAGDTDIYQLSHEEIGELLPQETKPSYFSTNNNLPNSKDDDNTQKWEYKGADGNIYGPYTTAEIKSWKEHGYFTGESSVLMRKVGEGLPVDVHSEAKTSGADELLNDFDSDDDESKREDIEINEWVDSDQIHF